MTGTSDIISFPPIVKEGDTCVRIISFFPYSTLNSRVLQVHNGGANHSAPVIVQQAPQLQELHRRTRVTPLPPATIAAVMKRRATTVTRKNSPTATTRMTLKELLLHPRLFLVVVVLPVTVPV